jgi:C4-dicarboxylate transporter DctQ subunit
LFSEIMQDLPKKLKNLFDAILDILVWISACILAMVIISVALEVFLRYAFNRPQAWVLEFSEYALLFITFLSAAYILKVERNITIDIVISFLTPRTRLILASVHYLIVSVVSFILCYFGSKVTLDLYERGIYNPTIMQVPMAYVLFVVPLGGFFLFVQSLIGLYSSFRKLGEKRPNDLVS